jgi:glutamyl-tRNA(Gln) amidotransferase subunit E
MDSDYGKLGFKCGIEIHQQLDTHKLFCSCPSLIREDEPDISVERKMRAVAGELGEVDPAALHEFLKNRGLKYEAYSDSTCLVELDEEPPHPLNPDALEIAAEVAMLLKARLVDELHVMRKTVIDGSNTAGFQRTILVATDGVLETNKGVVGIPTICLEEDAARKIEEKDNVTTYRLDRLGIPLVEIATTPNIKNPRHARDVAEKLGMLLRATGRVKRGLGTIRQDINVSIRQGARVEIKGVQNLNDIPKLLENEVIRQTRLVEITDELKRRGVREAGLASEPTDVSDVFAESGRDWMKAKINSGEKAIALRLKGFNGLLGRELSPDYRFGTELARIAKSATGLGGIIHSDEKLDPPLKEKLQGRLKAGETDGFICVIAKTDAALMTLKLAAGRCASALKGVPKETRTAVGLISEYMRPLPGSHRMYPETDEPLVIPDKGMLNRIKDSLPELFEEKAGRYEKMGLSAELASQLSKTTLAGRFEGYAAKYPEIKASLIATILLTAPKEAKKRYNAPVERLNERHFDELLGLLSKGAVTKDVAVELLAEASGWPDAPLADIAQEKQLTALGPKELESIVKKVLEENKELASKDKQKAAGILLGKVMGQCKGRADPETVRKLLASQLG